jgi:hypothetical protein
MHRSMQAEQPTAEMMAVVNLWNTALRIARPFLEEMGRDEARRRTLAHQSIAFLKKGGRRRRTR